MAIGYNGQKLSIILGLFTVCYRATYIDPRLPVHVKKPLCFGVARGPEDAGQQEVWWEPQRLSGKLMKLECLLMSFGRLIKSQVSCGLFCAKILSQCGNHRYHMGVLCNDIVVGVWEVMVSRYQTQVFFHISGLPPGSRNCYGLLTGI